MATKLRLTGRNIVIPMNSKSLVSAKSLLLRGPRGSIVVCEGVEWDDLGLRERLPHEPVHLHNDDDPEADDFCSVCGVQGGVWLAEKSSHEIHPNRCKV